jgi:hypothetical protein
MIKRKLSILQKAYKKFFLAMLAEYEVDSPAKLSYDQKCEFFTRIKEDWKVRKAKLVKEKIKKPAPSKKDQYAKVKVSRPSIPLEPKVAYTKTSAGISKVDSTYKPTGYKKKRSSSSKNTQEYTEKREEIFHEILSQENPEQTDELKIKYHPNQFFEQEDLYKYPVVKMPREGSYLKLPRKGRAMGRGYKELDFYNTILANIPEVEVNVDLHMAIPFYNRPYEPDIVLIDRELNLYIDIEIDEPYDGYYRFPTHETEKDDTRDLFFTESGWVVIRFTERQVHLQEKQCIAYIKDVLNSIYNYHLTESSNCISEPQWDYQQAVRWEKSHYREKYLGIERFGKQNTTSQVIVDISEPESIEDNLNRTKKKKTITLQDNIAFEDETHRYHHPKDETGNAEYISVTTLIDRFFPFDMDRFIQGKAKKEERSEEDVLDEFLKNRDEAAKKGTYLHEQIENFLKGKKYDASLTEFALFKNFYDQIVVTKGFEFVEAEKRILLDEFNVAGTVDAIFKKPNKDEFVIVDWKRSKNLVIDGHPKKYGYGYALSELSNLDNSSYYKYALQQNIYKYILEKKYGFSISSMNLIILHENFDIYYRVDLRPMNKEVEIILNSINHKI